MNEKERIQAVKQYEILDTPKDGAFDRITRLASKILNTPIALVSIVDSDRIWFKSIVGLEGISEIPKEPGLCSSAIMHDEVYMIENAIENPNTLHNSLVRGEFGLRFYAATQLRTSSGYNLGTLCVIDKEARTLSKVEQEVLVDLGKLVTEQLELRLKASKAIKRERSTYNILKAIYDSSSEASTFVDKNLTIRYSNRLAQSISEKIFGTPAKAGSSISDFIHPNLKEQASQDIEAVLSGKVVERETYDGQRWWASKVVPVYGDDHQVMGFSHHTRDITREHELQEEANKIRERLELLASNFPNGSISLVDKRLYFLYTGGSAYQLAKVNPNQFIGQPIQKLLIPDVYEQLVDKLPQVWKGISQSYEVTFNHRIYLATLQPVPDEDGEINRFAMIVLDITQRKQREEFIATQNERLKEIAWQQSHKVRGPVATILGLLPLIQQNDENQEYYLQLLKKSVQNLDDIIHHIVDMTVEAENSAPDLQESATEAAIRP